MRYFWFGAEDFGFWGVDERDGVFWGKECVEVFTGDFVNMGGSSR